MKLLLLSHLLDLSLGLGLLLLAALMILDNCLEYEGYIFWI